MQDDVQDPVFQAYLKYRTLRPKGFVETVKDYDYREMIPVVGAGFTAKNAYGVYQAAQAYQKGTATKDQALMLADLQRPSTFMGDVASVGLGTVGFGGDFLASGGLAAGVRGVAKRAAPEVAEKMATGIGKAVTQGAALGAIRVGQEQLLPEGGRVAAAQAERSTAVGFTDEGRMVAEAGDFEAAFPKAVLDVLIEDVSEFSGGLLTKATGVDAVKRGVVSWWAKKTGQSADDVLSQLGRTVRWDGIVGEYLEEIGGAAMREGTSLLPEKYRLEENTKPGDYLSAFPGVKESAAMLVAFSAFPAVATGARFAARGVLGQGGAVTETGEERAPLDRESALYQEAAAQVGTPPQESPTLRDQEQEGIVRGPGQGEMRSPGGASPVGREWAGTDSSIDSLPGATQADLEGPIPVESAQPNIEVAIPDAPPGEATPGVTEPRSAEPIVVPGVGSYQAVPESSYTPDERRAANTGRLFGTRVRFVETEDFGGVTTGPGEVVLRRGEDARKVLYHEAVHSLSMAEGGVDALYQRVRAVDAQGLRRASRAKLEALRASEGGVPLQAAQEAPRALRREETLATRAGELSSYMELLGRPEGKRHIQRLIRTDRGLLERILDAVRRLGAKVFGGEFRTRYERDLADLTDAIRSVDPSAPEATQQALRAADLIRQALEAGARAESGQVEGLDPRFVSAWQGTVADFSEYSDDALRSGEGGQAFGYGHYFASEKKVAEFYRDLVQEKRGGEGKLVKADLAPTEQEMLQWETPVREQSDAVRAGLDRINAALPEDYQWDGDATGGQVVRTLQRAATEVGLPGVEEESGDPRREASKSLLANGIRGTRYLDQQSRPGGKGTQNYVIFDAKDARVEARYAPKGETPERVKRERRRKTKLQKAAASLVEDFSGLPAETLTQKIRRSLQNRYERIDTYIAELAKAGGFVSEDTNVREAITRLPGRVETRLKRFERTHVKKVIGILKANGISTKDGGRYLYARHAPEANEHGMSKDPDGQWDPETKPFSGLATSVAQAEVEAAEKKPGYVEFGAAVDAMNAETRRTMLDGGLISQEQYDQWESMFDHYVPLRNPDGSEMAPEPRGKGFQIRGPETKSRGGRGEIEDAESVLVWSVSQGTGAIMRAEKNHIGQTFAQMLRENEGLATIETVEELPTDQASLDKLLAESFVFKENGQETRILLHDELLARALKDLGSTYPNTFFKVLGGLNRFLSQVNTALDPDFILANLVRDLQTAAISVGGDATGVKGMGTKIIRSVLLDPKFPALRAAIRGELGKAPRSEWDTAYQEFIENGGATGYAHLRTYEEQAAAIRKDLERGGIGHATSLSLDYLRNISGGFENATRLAAFYHMRKAGLSAKKAAVFAKNITVNFNDRGELGVLLNSLYLFYNAGVQGGVRVLRSLKSPKVQRRVAAMAVGGALIDLWMRAIAPDDDDGRNMYDKVPEWVKERNLVLWNPWGPTTAGLPVDGVQYVSIPLPWGFNVFPNLGRHIAAVGQGAETKTEATGRMLSTIVNAFNPVGSGTVLQTLLPTALDPLAQIAENKNWAGNPIAPPDMGFGPDKPASERYFRSVTKPSRAVTKWLNELTGGDEHTPGGIDISPEHIDHIYEFFAGGLGRLSERVYKLASRQPGEVSQISDVPILRRFVGHVPEWQTVGDFYSALDEIERARLRLRDGLGREGDQVLVSMRPGVVTKGGRSKSLKDRLSELAKLETQEAEKERQRLMKAFLRRYYQAVEQARGTPSTAGTR